MLWPIKFQCAGVWFQLDSILYTYIKVKVKIAPSHTCTRTEERYSSNPFATLALEAGGPSATRSGGFAPREYPVTICRTLGGPRALLDGQGISRPPPVGFDPWTGQLVISRYTDYAIPVGHLRVQFAVRILNSSWRNSGFAPDLPECNC